MLLPVRQVVSKYSKANFTKASQGRSLIFLTKVKPCVTPVYHFPRLSLVFTVNSIPQVKKQNVGCEAEKTNQKQKKVKKKKKKVIEFLNKAFKILQMSEQ